MADNSLTPLTPNWGVSGAPLIPAALRALWRGEKLPEWLAAEIGLPAASLDMLGAEVWTKGLTLTPRLEHYLVTLLDERRAAIQEIEVLQMPWPHALEMDEVNWRARTRNALTRAGLTSPRVLAHVTFGVIFNVQGMGTRSVLDFACTLEAAIDSMREETVELDDLLLDAIDAPWSTLVSDEDPRFAHLLPPGRGTVFQRLDVATIAGDRILGGAELAAIRRSLPLIRERIAEIENHSLDRALSDYVGALSGETGARLEALLARLGCDGQPPRTLEEAASMINVSRERIRQIQSRTLDRKPKSHPALMPALDRALELLSRASPIDARTAAELLRTEHVSTVPFHPRSVLAAAELCQRQPTFELQSLGTGERVVTNPSLVYGVEVISVASRQSDSLGVSNVSQVAAAITGNGSVDENQVKDLLTSYTNAEFFDEYWFWMPDRSPQRNRLCNLARRIVSVASPLDVATLREGIRRGLGHRGIKIVPPRDVLLAFFRAHPAFDVDGEGWIRSSIPLDYRVELGTAEQTLVDVLRSSPTGILDRASFEDGCVARGMNVNTFNVYTTYSPVVEHLGTDVWALRGVRVDPLAVEALRRANAQRPRERRVQDYGWTPEGHLWLSVRLASAQGLVLSIPSSIERYVADRRYDIVAEDGAPTGTVVVNQEGFSWGYGPFLSRFGADEGDILYVEFDLAAVSVRLELGGDELLED